MTRPLPVPVSEFPDKTRQAVASLGRARDLVQRAAPLAPVVGELVHRLARPERVPRPPSTEGFVLVEALSIRLLEDADGSRLWELEHVSMEKPRRRGLPGRWLLGVSCLSLLAWAVTRSVRLDLLFQRPER
ncbi:hypothetical protein OO015_08710 [Thermomicrobium sp. 4228-Ro]|uniref:hypothetical protein n=1 Tax=Thermomicrobium sp. 4228-Ro TaxID=2993937 RepID=UPI0022497623|nr:hypothetical protein [Thermomicrobium sp. 4228-Ro]MCX2727573.1 hypothetical protein [Thermomicrobium sp. 4228-Ro]